MAQASPPRPERRPWAALAVLAVAQFMVILDVTVVNVALPTIGASLRFAPADLSWVVTAYVLFTGGLMLLGGRLADRLGARRTFAAGLLVFTGASRLSGRAWTPAALVAARALQGTGAALLLPSALALVTVTYSGHQRAVALAVWGALGSAGAAAGVLFGGIITSVLSWEWVFLVNVPIGLAVAALLRRSVPAAAGTAGRLDLAGALALITGLAALVYGIDRGEPAALGAGAVLLLAFAGIERRVAAPLVPPATWRARSLVSGAALMLGATGILVGSFYVNSLRLQDELGATPLQAGLAFLPLALVILAGAHVASRLLPRVGTRAVIAGGLLIAAGGELGLSLAPPDARYASDLLPGFVALGFGIGLAFVAVSVAAMQHVPHERAGLASGVMTTAHEIGGALGIAVLATAGDASLAAAVVAAGLALAALAAAPAVRPAPGAAVGMH
jgi:EmrB/QacA subfamily drug resistance transporter